MAGAAGVERPASESTQDVIQALRTAQHHQVQLNVLADQKANINIGFTLFFITLTQAQFGLAEGEPAVVRAGFMLLILAIASSLLLALLVVLPRMRRQRVRAAEQMSNPFYFGLFTQLEQQEYVDYLVVELENRGRARELIAADIYQIGQVLRRKYRLLRASYACLAFAAVLAVILYCFKIVTA